MKVNITTDDNVTLSATVIEANEAKGVVIINPSTATNTNFYRPFATYLSERHFHVVIWNYRGFCDSRSESLASVDYRYSDIGCFDIPAVVNKVKSLFPDLPLCCIGHSAGGHQIGFSDCHKKLDAMIAVAVSAGYFRHMTFYYRLQALFFFKLFTPVCSRLFGYVPANKISPMENLPATFTREWGQWCTEPDWFFSPRFAGQSVPPRLFEDYATPTYVISSDDDEICTEPNIRNYWKHIPRPPTLRFIRYQTAQLASESVGHLGYFRRKNRAIWEDMLAILNSTCGEKGHSINAMQKEEAT